MESRQLLTTYYVEPVGYAHPDLTHLATLQGAIAAASAGDIVTIEPKATVAAIQQNPGLFTASASSGSAVIQSNLPFGPGQFVVLGYSSRRALVDRVQPGPAGSYLETLSQPLTSSFMAGEPIIAERGVIGIDKAITIDGELAAPRFAFDPSLSIELVQGARLGTVLSHLNLATLRMDGGSGNDLIVDCSLGLVDDSNDGGNSFLGNSITGSLSLTGTLGMPMNDVVKGNTFTDSTGAVFADGTALLGATSDNGLFATENTFALTSQGAAAIRVSGSSNVAVFRNTINAANRRPQIVIVAPASGVVVTNNLVSTGGFGTGIQTQVNSMTDAAQTSLKIEGNDLRANRVGIDVVGDGSTDDPAGTIDAGGGSLGSVGGNDFRGFLAAGLPSGIVAIQLTKASSSATVSAHDNLWDSSVLANPTAVVKDSTHDASIGTAGVGTVAVGSTQLSADQEFVQALYNQFLARSGTVAELNNYVAQIAKGDRSAVASSVIHSDEAYRLLIETTYEQNLGRSADPTGLASYLSYLHAHTEEQFLGQVLGSSEFAARAIAASGSTDGTSSFVQAAFQSQVGRPPTVDELANFTGQVIAYGRQYVASEIPILFASLANEVSNFYATILHRTYVTGQSEINGYVNSGMNLLAIEASMAASDEYYARG